jgi:hypothetical protein
MVKIGRNEQCPCGSGKKYKKCCLMKKDTKNPPPVPQEVIEYFQRKQMEHTIQEKTGILINYVTPALFQGKKVWAIGNKVYGGRPEDETFHQFIIFILYESLGNDWWKEQGLLAPTDRHFIAKCFDNFNKWMEKTRATGKSYHKGRVLAGRTDGYSKSLLSLAFDMATLRHINTLPETLLNRLKNNNEYQGARYEIAIAAIFARLGYKVVFTNEKDTQKHCEFFATDPVTGITIAIEAKSKHRDGVLNQKGEMQQKKKLLSANFSWALTKAIGQAPGDMPFMIFLDANSPVTPELPIEDKQWIIDAKKIVKEQAMKYNEGEIPFNVIFVTNFSYHYQTEDDSLSGEAMYIPLNNTKFPSPDAKFFENIQKALDYNGFVPNIDIDELDYEKEKNRQ